MAGNGSRAGSGRSSGVGKRLGGSRSVISTRQPVSDTILREQPRAAARRVGRQGGNPMQQRAAANANAMKSMRRSRTGRDRARRTTLMAVSR